MMSRVFIIALGVIGAFALKHQRQSGVKKTEAKCEAIERGIGEAELAQGLIDQALATPSDTRAQQIAIASFDKLTRDPHLEQSMNATSFNSMAEASKKVKAAASKLYHESSMLVNDALQTAADEAQNPAMVAFLRQLRLCSVCNDYVRVGEPHDGGYIICADGLQQGLKGAYSYGIDGFDGWGMHMASVYKVPLYEYDCFDTRVPYACPGCQVQFIPECIKGQHEANANPKFKPFTQHVTDNGQAAVPDSSLMLKVDVEGAEWNAMALSTTDSLRKVRHLNLELHNILATANFELYGRAMKMVLDAGFVVTHLHGNNWGGMAYAGPYSIPNFLEVTLVRGSGCVQNVPYTIPENMTCNKAAAELPDAVLPPA